MLTKKVFQNQLEILVKTYPNWKLNVSDGETVKVWYNQFKNYDDEDFKRMVQDYIDNEKFPPTVAGIKEKDGDDGVTVV